MLRLSRRETALIALASAGSVVMLVSVLAIAAPVLHARRVLQRVAPEANLAFAALDVEPGKPPRFEVLDAAHIVDDGERRDVVEEAVDREVPAPGILRRRTEGVVPQYHPLGVYQHPRWPAILHLLRLPVPHRAPAAPPAP